MERKVFTSLREASARVLLGETHMIGKTVIVKGKKGKVVKQVSSDGKTESDEIYQVKFEDGTVEDIPARDMEMQGDISNTKEPSENEAEDIVSEGHDCAKIHPNMSHKEWKKTQKESVELDEGKFKAHSGIPGMSKKGKGILSHMANSFETTGGPWLDHDNVHNLTHHGVKLTLNKAHKHLEDNPHPEASKQLALIKKELGESVEIEEGRIGELLRKVKEYGKKFPGKVGENMPMAAAFTAPELLRPRPKDPEKRVGGREHQAAPLRLKDHVEIEEGGKDVVKKGKPMTISLDLENPIGDKMNKGRKKKLKADDPPSEDLLNTITNIVNTANTREIHNKSEGK